MTKAIGYIKAKKTVYCEICGQTHRRSVQEPVCENTEMAKAEAKDSLLLKLNKKYTCRICKSITKDLT